MIEDTISLLIAGVTLLIGGLTGGLVIAYKVHRTLKLIQSALLDGQLTQAELITIIADLLSYRSLLGNSHQKVK